MINDPSNYAMMTIDEFEFLLDYMEKFNFDLTAIQLINTYLLTKDMDASELKDQMKDTKAPAIHGPVVEEPKATSTKWRIAPESNTIPDL